MRNSKIILMGFMTVLLLAVCCGRERHDSRLERIWGYVSDKPEAAIAALDSIDVASMSESDRAFYNLMCIKAKDKAYVVHTSDSLILTVIDHYSRHKGDNLYAEALYYGGRVYSDLGDYPTALHYFQEALDLLPENTPHPRLRGNVLSQTGGLLNDLGLHKQAIPYIESVLKINHQQDDSPNLALDYKMLGSIYLNLKDYESALKYFMDAEKFAVHLSKENLIEIKIHEAAALYYKNDINNALKLIRVYIGETDRLAMNYALSFASKIYLKANILDTAYMYARQLTLSTNPDNKKSGYMVMLSPELSQFIPKDSLAAFYSDYKLALEKEFIHQETNGALIQNSMYNYSLHDKMRRNAERSRTKIIFMLVALIALVAIMMAIIFYLRNRNKCKVIELHEAMAKLSVLENVAANKRIDENGEATSYDIDSIDDIEHALSDMPQKVMDEKSLKAELRIRLKELNTNSIIPYKVPSQVTDSLPYLTLKSYLKKGDPIPDKDGVWIEVENVVLKCFPNFKSTLQLLSDGDLNVDDLRIALLLKCGFSLGELGILIGRTKGAVTYRRKKLSVRLFGEKLNLELVDNIIRTL